MLSIPLNFSHDLIKHILKRFAEIVPKKNATTTLPIRAAAGKTPWVPHHSFCNENFFILLIFLKLGSHLSGATYVVCCCLSLDESWDRTSQETLVSQTYSLVSLQSCFSQVCLTSDQTGVPFHLQFSSERDKQGLRFSLGLVLSWRACGISLGSNKCTLCPVTRSFWAGILKNWQQTYIQYQLCSICSPFPKGFNGSLQERGGIVELQSLQLCIHQ